MDPECELCLQTQHRRCVGNFAQKYLSGDQLKAKCGSSIMVETVDQATGKAAPAEWLDDIHLEVPLRMQGDARCYSHSCCWRCSHCVQGGAVLDAAVASPDTVQVRVLEGKAYSELPANATEEQLEGCVLLTNSHGKELLAAGRGAEQAESKQIVLRISESQARSLLAGSGCRPAPDAVLFCRPRPAPGRMS